MKRFLAAVLALTGALSAMADEASLRIPSFAFGGQIASWLELPAPASRGMPDSLAPVSGRERASARLTMDWESASLSLGASAALGRDGGRPELAVDEALLAAAPADFLTVKLGRFRLDDSAALLLGVADFLCPQDVETLLSGDAEEASLPEDLLAVTFLAGDFSFRLVCAPFEPPSVLPDPGSPWFPDAILPQSLEILGNTHTIRGVEVADPAPGQFVLDPAFLAAVAYSGNRGDVGASFFAGPDRDAAWSSNVLLDSLMLPGKFDAELFRRGGYVKGASLSGSLILGEWRIAAESSYRNGKEADTSELDDTGAALIWNYLPETIDEAAGVLSLSWSPASAPIRAVAEIRGSRWFGAEAGTLLPTLGNTAAFALSWSLPIFDSTIDALYLVSLTDSSTAATLRGTLPFGADAELSILVPLFSGDGESELGRYGQQPVATVALKARF
ncbi:MAG: hypothetical protein A2Z99_07725 [Treponema sp. GWB1_62_6]|nr:MAG: hypothetical protein A2Z99_07725 [Treponema sp. GWB1_62_6]OHE68603.1 MAG: hypothetical protein A2001_05720 [Treponema sp. GWC1_61_84]HCM26552.1 hypothetical protein [Treponema sp.]